MSDEVKVKEPVTQDKALDNIVPMNGKDFEIVAPDALIMLRALRVVSRVIQRADATARDRGIALFKQAAEAVSAEGEGPTPMATSAADDMIQKVMVFMMTMEDDDLLTFATAVLQMPDEAAGKRWLKKYGLRLAPLVRALMLNLEQMDDVIEALKVFTPALTGLKLLKNTVQGT